MLLVQFCINKKLKTMKWKRQPQETTGTYHFSGRFLVTSGVQALLSESEIFTIYQEVQQLVKENNGMDYLFSYIHEDIKQKLFFIDQLNQEMIASGDFKEEYNYCTLMLSSEY